MILYLFLSGQDSTTEISFNIKKIHFIYNIKITRRNVSTQMLSRLHIHACLAADKDSNNVTL